MRGRSRRGGGASRKTVLPSRSAARKFAEAIFGAKSGLAAKAAVHTLDCLSPAPGALGVVICGPDLRRLSSSVLGMRFAAQLFVRSSPGSIDLQDILSVCCEGEALNRPLLREMLGYFIDENRRRLATLAEAVEAEDRDALGHEAHAVRGSAAMLGAGRLHDLAWCLELDARGSDRSALRRSVAALHAELDAVVNALHNAHPEAWTD